MTRTERGAKQQARAGGQSARQTMTLDRDDYTDETLTAPSAEGAELREKTFDHCTVSGGSLARAKLSRCLFDDCVIEGCDLTMMAPFNTSFRGVRFEGCKLMGVDWTVANPRTLDVSFHRCVLSYDTFVGMRLHRLELIECTLVEANFTDADLTGARLTGSDLSGAVFHSTILTGADLRDTRRCAIDPRANTLRNTKLSIDGLLASAAFVGIAVPDLAGDPE